ncbi:MAG: hypothetical protein Q9216_005019 [Gyalolechia sp. 2 TL-2023]
MFHSGPSSIGLIAFIERFRYGAEVLLFLPAALGRLDVDRTTIGGCFVASHDIVEEVDVMAFGTRTPSYSSSSSSPRRSSSDMRELGWLPLLSVTWLKVEAGAERKSPAGHDGYAQMTVWGETDEDGGVSGEKERSEEVVEGGDKQDFGGILMGFAKLPA